MAKYLIDVDERYPTYALYKPNEGLFGWGSEVEVPDDLYIEYINIEQAYDAFQEKLSELYKTRRKSGYLV